MTVDNKEGSFETEMMEMIERRERLQPDYYAKAKAPSVRILREMGMEDAKIAKMLGLSLPLTDL